MYVLQIIPGLAEADGSIEIFLGKLRTNAMQGWLNGNWLIPFPEPFRKISSQKIAVTFPRISQMDKTTLGTPLGAMSTKSWRRSIAYENSAFSALS